MLIWAGNLSDEIPWYLARVDGGWRPLALVLVFVGFMLPFFLLLFRPLKRRRGTLAAIAGLVCVTQLAHVYWLVAPPFEPTGRPRPGSTCWPWSASVGCGWRSSPGSWRHGRSCRPTTRDWQSCGRRRMQQRDAARRAYGWRKRWWWSRRW